MWFSAEINDRGREYETTDRIRDVANRKEKLKLKLRDKRSPTPLVSIPIKQIKLPRTLRSSTVDYFEN